MDEARMMWNHSDVTTLSLLSQSGCIDAIWSKHTTLYCHIRLRLHMLTSWLLWTMGRVVVTGAKMSPELVSVLLLNPFQVVYGIIITCLGNYCYALVSLKQKIIMLRSLYKI